MTAPDPARLVQLLTDAGWTNTGGRPGEWVRLELRAEEREAGRLLVIPLYPALNVSDELAELQVLAEVGRRAQQVLDGLGDTGTVPPRG